MRLLGAQGTAGILYIKQRSDPTGGPTTRFDSVKNVRSSTVKNILFKFIQNTVMYKNVHIFHSVYILKKDNCNFKYVLLTCRVNIVLGPYY